MKRKLISYGTALVLGLGLFTFAAPPLPADLGDDDFFECYFECRRAGGDAKSCRRACIDFND
jgi:hypothetical protein